jgi:hypothetical protein
MIIKIKDLLGYVSLIKQSIGVPYIMWQIIPKEELYYTDFALVDAFVDRIDDSIIGSNLCFFIEPGSQLF